MEYLATENTLVTKDKSIAKVSYIQQNGRSTSTTVKSPAYGKLLDLNLIKDDQVTIGQTVLFTVVTPATEIIVSILESDYSKVNMGAEVTGIINETVLLSLGEGAQKQIAA